MRHPSLHVRLVALIFGLLLCFGLLPSGTASPVAAQVAPGGYFGSAVPCLLGESTFATTCAADTIANPVPAGDPALVQFSRNGKGPLAPLGARPNPNANASIVNGIGSTYGLAYDDGAVSGRQRLLVAAYTKRLVSFGPGGPGGIYEYSFTTGSWSATPVASLAAWSGTGRSASDVRDRAMVSRVGKTGLGDMEIAPDGRTLYVTNLATRQIERFDLSTGPLVRQLALSLPFGLISADPVVQADLRPFALEFHPAPLPGDPAGSALVVGMTDTAQRGGGATPSVHVLTYRTGNGSWAVALSQSLVAPAIDRRFDGSTYSDIWASSAYASWGVRAWNPWIDDIDNAPARVSGTTAVLLYPQPLLTDIEFDRSGLVMYLGLRDRSGDQTYFENAPQPEKISIAQGDTLVYRLSGSWQLQSVSRSDPSNEDDASDRLSAAASDYFNDTLHAYGGASAPPHPENHMGALATSLQGGAGGFSERVTVSTLLGSERSGFSLYDESGGQRATYIQLIAAGDPNGSKASALGDVELLCTYAFVGGRLWQDIDGDGVQDASEQPFANITLELFQGGDATAPALARATSGADGRYLFAAPPNTAFNIRIAPASRQVLAAAGWRFSQANQGGNDTRDSDAHPSRGYIEFFGSGAVGTGVTRIPVPVRPRESDERSFDLGLTRVAPTGQIGDKVWDDQNRNGLQEAGEPGLGNLTVSLHRDDLRSAAPALRSYPLTTRTNGASGNYLFQDVEPGIYQVQFSLPAGYGPTRINAGADDRDSDADAASGYRSAWVEIAPDDPSTALSEDINRTLDFGLISSGVDLWVTKSGPAQALVDQAFAYSLAYANGGPGVANAVTLVDTLPAGVTYLSASPAPAAVVGSTLTWNLGQLAANQGGSISVQVRAPATLAPPATSQPITNRVTIRTTSTDTNPSNDSDTHTTQVVRPEVSITKSAPATVLVGDELVYNLAYANTGSVAASTITIADALANSLTFVRFAQNPGGACGYNVAAHMVRCNFASLAPGASGLISFVVRVETRAGATLDNSATIATSTAGDDPANNRSTSSTSVLRPNPGVSISIAPSPFPVGSGGAISVGYRNPGTGVARSTTLAVVLTAGNFTLGALPGGCTYSAATRTLACALGDLAAGATGTRSIPISLPANFSADSLGATATIATLTPERPSDLTDNSASASVQVVRPNVYVDAAGPDRIVAQGSVFWYTVDYGNIYRRNPALTRAAQNVVLRATLPADVTYLRANTVPATISGSVLSWNLGTLNAGQTGQIVIVVQTDVPAGAVLDFEAVISTTTPGDDPADNRDTVVTDVVQPPADIAPATGDLRLAIHSELDPNSQDSNPTNGVYLSEGTQISWPAGEVLDFTPRLRDLVFADEPLPFPYEYRARVIGWSISGFAFNGGQIEPTAPDSRGRSGCRPGAATNGAPELLAGCRYGYIGGADLDAMRAPAVLREEQLRDQAHAYWTQPPAPAMRDDVYLYTIEPLAPVTLSLQIEIEVWVVNAYPGEIDGLPLPEIPVAPLPAPERQLIGQAFEITLLVPRSLVGPGSASR